ncbi:MAG TPA: antibiotic biosynthesis monooxygenase [Allosphingosinicella sp.]|nr:antibiotic biosynthesis monooxygenase [Allosphingosinicella sp.]
MFAILWRYQVHDVHRADFEATYGPSGDWARLFERGRGFQGTQLLRGADGIYVTVDVWRDREDFRAFLAEHEEDYRVMDQRTEGWTGSEERLGEFETAD